MFLISDILIKNTPKKGRGVFTKKEVPAGTVIGDYLGKIILPSKEDEKTQGLYSMYGNDFFTILPDPNIPGIHLINHSCEANLGMYKFQTHTLYFALRKIYKGEELLVSYQLDPPDETCNPCTHECKCDSKFCRGTMHTSRKDAKRYMAYMNKGIDQKLRPEYGKHFPVLKRYPTKIADQTIHNIFANERIKPLKKKYSRMLPLQALRRELREEGRTLEFPVCNLRVLGVMGKCIISKSIDIN